MDKPWPFSDPPNTMAFVSRSYFHTDPICRVYHNWEDGTWEFHPDGDASDSDIMIVCLHDVSDRDSSIDQLSDLPHGWMAERSDQSAPWIRQKAHPYPVHADDGFYLDDATEYERLYPELYQIPSPELRENLRPGQLAKLIFRFAAEMAARQNNECERMWVEVLEKDDDYGRYRGRLLNQPKLHSTISKGHELWLHPVHVFAIQEEEK